MVESGVKLGYGFHIMEGLGYRLLSTMSRRLPVPALLGLLWPFSWLFSHFPFFLSLVLPSLFLLHCPFRSSLTVSEFPPPGLIVTDFLSFSSPPDLILSILIVFVIDFSFLAQHFFATSFLIESHCFLSPIFQIIQIIQFNQPSLKSLKPFDLS